MVLYMITTLSGLEDTKVNKQVARSEADMQEDCIYSAAIDGEGGGGSHSPAYPSFLVLL